MVKNKISQNNRALLVISALLVSAFVGYSSNRQVAAAACVSTEPLAVDKSLSLNKI